MSRYIYSIVFSSACLVFSLTANAQTSSSWYKQNQAAIDTLRKGDFFIQIVDASNNPIDANISYKLTKHDFPWGTAINLESSSDDEEWYRAVARTFFNSGVPENAFKWSSMQANPGEVNYDDVNRYLDWADESGWSLRGHTLLWGSKDYEDFHPLMKWVKDLPVPDMINECKLRVQREMNYYQGRIHEYDVLNEASLGHASYLQSVVGDSINWNCFKWAREADPNAKLYINDYNIIAWNDMDKYNTVISSIIENGAPLDGIGVQGHFGSSLNAYTITSKLNQLSAHNLPIKITEFDMTIGDGNVSENMQAIYYANAMRACFAHPNVNGFLFWGFWDNRHWRDGAGIFESDKHAKVAADSVYYLIHEKWSTKGSTEIKSTTPFKLNAYYGEYTIVMDMDGQKKSMNINLRKENKGDLITLKKEDFSPKAPEITRMLAIDNRYIKIVFDTEVDMNRRQNSEFKIFDSTKKASLMASQPEDDSTIVILRMKDEMDKDDEYTATFIPGVLKGKNNVSVQFSGMRKVENMIPYFVSAHTNISGDTIAINISQTLLSPSADELSSFAIVANGSTIIATDILLNPVNNKQLLLVLDSKITKGSDITLKYTANNMLTTEGGKVSSFGAETVENHVATSIETQQSSPQIVAFYQTSTAHFILRNEPSHHSSIHYKIYSLSGKIINTGQLSEGETIRIDASPIPAGLYILECNNKQGWSYAQKLIRH